MLGAVKAASLLSAAAFRGASGLDRASAQRRKAGYVMVGRSMSSVRSLVDAFVARINSGAREAQPGDDVPAFLRENMSDETASSLPEGWTSWRIIKCDNSERINELQERTGRLFPPSFHYFVANYSFPAFEFGPLLFFANTGEDTFWELQKRLFQDKHMSPHLLQAGFLQIGNPMSYNYDPVCFDCKGPRKESRIVQLDHEAILQHGEMKTAKEIASSFPDFLRAALR